MQVATTTGIAKERTLTHHRLGTTSLHAQPGQEASAPARYRTQAELGRGGQGVVRLCLDEVLGREVAVKISTAGDAHQRARFAAEARTTAILEHPSIIPVYDAGDGWFTMRRLHGDPLYDLIESAHRRLDPQRIAEILIGVCNAIAYAHDQGIIHRDLKADNIVVGRYGEVAVIDWGMAVGLDQGKLPDRWHGLEVPSCVGTPACLPPEVALAMRGAIGTAADVWMLGAVIYHCLAGMMPYEDALQIDVAITRAASSRFRDLAALRPRAPAGLVELAQQAMDPLPSGRPSARQLSDRLRSWLARWGNLAAGEAALVEARRLAEAGRSAPRRDVERLCDHFARSLASFDQAIALLPDHPTATTEREGVMHEFVLGLISAGEIVLARFLQRHGMLPIGRPAVDGTVRSDPTLGETTRGGTGPRG